MKTTEILLIFVGMSFLLPTFVSTVLYTVIGSKDGMSVVGVPGILLKGYRILTNQDSPLNGS